MVLTENEFQTLIANNPHVKIHTNKKEKQEKEKKAKKSPKYLNSKVYVYEDGFVSGSKNATNHGTVKEKYDSRKEYLRHMELSVMEEAGQISKLDRQCRLEIQPKFTYKGKTIRAISYMADFSYIRDGVQVIEDVKAFDEKRQKYLCTEAFLLKWKLLKARYPDYSFELY